MNTEKGSGKNPPEDAHKHIVRVRTLVNHKVLKVGDVLRAFDRDGQRGDKWPLGAVTPISLSKVARNNS